MKEQIYQLFAQSMAAGPSLEDLLLRTGAAVVLGFIIFVSY